MKIFNYIVLDFETGGLDRKNNCHAQVVPITEVGVVGVRGDTLEEIVRYETKIKGQWVDDQYRGYDPKLEYQKEALEFTNITIEELENGKDSKEVVKDLCKIFGQCKTGTHLHKPILVGHNVTYDIPFLQHLFEFHNKDLSKYLSGYKDHKGVFHPNYIDTMWLSRVKTPIEKTKHTLEKAMDRENLTLFNAHSALDDVLGTLELFKSYTYKLRTNLKGEVEVVDHREKFFIE